MKQRWILTGMIMGFFFIAGCSSRSAPVVEDVSDQGPERPIVVASISPLAWIAGEIGADLIELIPLMSEGSDPGTWTPDTVALDALATADLIILNGANLEPWSQRVSLPIVRTLEVARNFKDQWIRYPAVVTHSHGPEGERSYEGSDGHTWIDPELLRLSAVSIRDRLVRLLPQHRKSLEDRWQQVDAVLSSLAVKISSISTETSVLVLESGPHWGYPVARAGWSLKRIDLDPTGIFDPSLADTLSALINESSIRLLLWASTPSADLVAALSEQLQIESVVWPLGFSLGDNYSRYPEIQAIALERLAEAYSKAAGRP